MRLADPETPVNFFVGANQSPVKAAPSKECNQGSDSEKFYSEQGGAAAQSTGSD